MTWAGTPSRWVSIRLWDFFTVAHATGLLAGLPPVSSSCQSRQPPSPAHSWRGAVDDDDAVRDRDGLEVLDGGVDRLRVFVGPEGCADLGDVEVGECVGVVVHPSVLGVDRGDGMVVGDAVGEPEGAHGFAAAGASGDAE